MRLTGALALLATGATAQSITYTDDATQTCLNSTSPPEQSTCAGLSASACMDATPDGGTTVGMVYCLDREAKFWDARLNAVYGVLRDRAAASDAEMARIGSSAPRIEPALRDMQRAWITFRDATCAFEQSQWGGGTGGGPASVSCMLQMTAAQALYLETAWIGN
jgi:uncharacterized protein YecT (DUF1311 family)